MTGTEMLHWLSENMLLIVVLWLVLILLLLFLYYQRKVMALQGKVRMLENDLNFQRQQNEEMQKEIPVASKNYEDITIFEKEQEESSIISYEELVKAVRGEAPPLKEEQLEIPLPEPEKKFHATEIISPVYGKQTFETQTEPKTMKKDDLESFLSSLIELRKKLE